MFKSALVVSLLVASAGAFAVAPRTRQRRQTRLFGGASKYATSPAGKKAKVERINELLTKSQMIFSVPAGSLTVAQSQALRRSMPEGTSVGVVKNTLLERAVVGTDFEEGMLRSEKAAELGLLSGPNMWFFIEDDVSGSIKALNQFLKESGKRETHFAQYGMLEGAAYDAAGVEQIGKLPSKDELYAKIAGGILMVPTKVARVLKAPNSKLARAIKLATEKNEE